MLFGSEAFMEMDEWMAKKVWKGIIFITQSVGRYRMGLESNEWE